MVQCAGEPHDRGHLMGELHQLTITRGHRERPHGQDGALRQGGREHQKTSHATEPKIEHPGQIDYQGQTYIERRCPHGSGKCTGEFRRDGPPESSPSGFSNSMAAIIPLVTRSISHRNHVRWRTDAAGSKGAKTDQDQSHPNQ
jgi:hypothetical protein